MIINGLILYEQQDVRMLTSDEMPKYSECWAQSQKMFEKLKDKPQTNVHTLTSDDLPKYFFGY